MIGVSTQEWHEAFRQPTRAGERVDERRGTLVGVDTDRDKILSRVGPFQQGEFCVEEGEEEPIVASSVGGRMG